MSASIVYPKREFACRHCKRKATVSSPFRMTRAQAAKKVKMKNTRWGTECLDCTAFDNPVLVMTVTVQKSTHARLES